jgi:zinc protease
VNPFLPALMLLSLAAPTGDERNLLPAARELTLDNGLRAVLIENHDAPVVASVVIVRAGAVDEQDGQGGSAHMLEHFLFNGTATRSREEIQRLTELHGIYNNAHTGLETTSYMVLAHRDQARVALELQADMLFHSTLPAAQMAKEKEVVLNEIARGASPGSEDPIEAARGALLAGTRLGRDPLGTPDSVRALEREALLAFYRARYVPNAMTAVIMGDFDAKEMDATVREIFGAAPRGGERERSGDDLSPPAGGRRIELTAPSPEPHVTLIAAAPTWGEPGSAAMRVLADRLPSLLGPLLAPGSAGPGAQVQADYEPYSSLALFTIVVEGDAGEPGDRLERRVREALATVERDGFSEADIAPARTRLLADEVYLSEKPHYFGMLNGPAIAIAGWPAYRDGLDALWRLDAETLRRQLAQVLSPARVVTVVAAPPAPPRAEAAAPAPDLVTLHPENGPLVRVTHSAASRVFGAHVLVRGRQSREPATQGGIADLLHRCLLLGAGGGDRQALETALARQGARLKTADDPSIPYDDFYTTRDFSFVRFETLDRDAFEQGIPVLISILRTPTLDDAAVEHERAEAIKRTDAGRRGARDAARVLLDTVLFGAGTPYARPVSGTPESLAALKPEDVRRFHREYFAPGNLVITVVTSLDAGRVAEALVKGLTPAAPRADSAPAPPAAVIATAPLMTPVATTPRSAAPRREHLGRGQAVVLRGRVLPIESADRPAAQAAVALLSDRMGEELRERRGLAYALGATLTPVGEGSPQWVLEIRVETRPEQLEAARQALADAITAAGREKPSPDDVERVSNRVAGQELMRRLSRVNLAYAQGLAIYHGLDPSEVPGSGPEWRALTPDAVLAAARRLFTLDQLVEVLVD